MERLTYVTEDGEILFHPEDLPEDEGMTVKELAENRRWKTLDQIVEKLTNMEQMEEHGFLVRLPCKVGDTVWDIDTGYPEPYKITAFSYGCHDLVGFGCDDDITFYYTSCRRQTAGAFLLSEIGKTVFLTCEKAEKKLEEMKK